MVVLVARPILLQRMTGLALHHRALDDKGFEEGFLFSRLAGFLPVMRLRTLGTFIRGRGACFLIMMMMMMMMMMLAVCVMLRLAGERGDVARTPGLPIAGTWSNTHASSSSRGHVRAS